MQNAIGIYGKLGVGIGVDLKKFLYIGFVRACDGISVVHECEEGCVRVLRDGGGERRRGVNRGCAQGGQSSVRRGRESENET